MTQNISGKPWFPNCALCSWLLPALVVAAGLALTALSWRFMWFKSRAAAHYRFEQLAERVHATISERIADQEQALQGIRGLYSASKSVEREEMRRYVSHIQRLGEGELGYGFIHYVRRSELQTFLEATRADGAADFQINTSGASEDLFVIEFIEPLADNVAAEGFDIAQEPRRREAAVRAAKEDRAILTKQITLVQDEKKRPGFLLLLPIYGKGTALLTPEQRWEALVGWAYAPLRIDGLLLGLQDRAEQLLDYHIYEHASGSTEDLALLIDSREHPDHRDGIGLTPSDFTGRTFWKKAALKVAGREWEVYVSTRPEFDQQHGMGREWAILGTGVLISLLAGGMTFSLRQGRERAVVLAEQMTQELREENTQREQVSRRLAEVSQFQKGLLDGAAHAIISTSVDGIIRSFNPAAERLLGYQALEVMGTQTPGLFHEPSEIAARAQEFGLELGQTLEPGFGVFVAKSNRGLPNEHEWTYIRKDGTRLPVWLSVTALRDGSGVLTGYLGMAIDISARRQAEEKLRRSEVFNRSILDSVSAQIAVLDRDGVIVAVNESWRRFALENSDTPGRPALRTSTGINYLSCCRTDTDCASHRDAAKAREGIQAVLDGKLTHFSFEYPCHSRREKRWFSLSVTPLGLSEGGAVVAHTNITMRKQAEMEVSKAREAAEQALHEVKFQQAALDQHAIVSVTDLAGRIQYANDKFCAIAGYSREELLGQKHRIVNSSYHPAGFWKEMWHTIARGDTWEGVCACWRLHQAAQSATAPVSRQSRVGNGVKWSHRGRSPGARNEAEWTCRLRSSSQAPMRQPVRRCCEAGSPGWAAARRLGEQEASETAAGTMTAAAQAEPRQRRGCDADSAPGERSSGQDG